MKASKHLLWLGLVLLPDFALGGVAGTTGGVTVIPAPGNASNNVLESDTAIFAFAERQNTTLVTGLPVDISVPGSTPASSTNDNFSSATIPAGTLISSYYLHFDAVGSPSTPVESAGSITFDSDVLGLIVLANSLNASAANPGLATTVYSTNGGLEINSTPAFDSLTLSPNRRTLTVDLRDANSPDDIRIITAVPEPGSLSLIAIGAAGVLGRRRR